MQATVSCYLYKTLTSRLFFWLISLEISKHCWQVLSTFSVATITFVFDFGLFLWHQALKGCLMRWVLSSIGILCSTSEGPSMSLSPLLNTAPYRVSNLANCVDCPNSLQPCCPALYNSWRCSGTFFFPVETLCGSSSFWLGNSVSTYWNSTPAKCSGRILLAMSTANLSFFTWLG